MGYTWPQIARILNLSVFEAQKNYKSGMKKLSVLLDESICEDLSFLK